MKQQVTGPFLTLWYDLVQCHRHHCKAGQGPCEPGHWAFLFWQIKCQAVQCCCGRFILNLAQNKLLVLPLLHLLGAGLSIASSSVL